MVEFLQVGDFVRDDNTFIIRHENKQGRLDLAGNVVIPPEYDRLTTSASDYMRAKLKGDEKEGLISVATGQAVTPFAYDEVINTYPRGISTPSIAMTLVDGFAAVLVDGKIGFINDKVFFHHRFFDAFDWYVGFRAPRQIARALRRRAMRSRHRTLPAT